jgi:hypothetical protein
MKTIEISEFTLDTLIESLESSVRACQKVDYTLSKKEQDKLENVEKTAPYAIGYSSSAVQYVIEHLKDLKSKED